MNKKPESLDKYIGVMLCTMRKARGRSRKEISTVIGVSYQQLHKYETGQSRLPASYIHRIACHLKLPIYIFFPTDPDNPFKGFEDLL